MNAEPNKVSSNAKSSLGDESSFLLQEASCFWSQIQDDMNSGSFQDDNLPPLELLFKPDMGNA